MKTYKFWKEYLREKRFYPVEYTGDNFDNNYVEFSGDKLTVVLNLEFPKAAKKEKTPVDYDDMLVKGIEIPNPYFAYPRGCISDTTILLTNRYLYTNVNTLNTQNFEKALYLIEHPIESKINIMSNFLKEYNLFVKNFDRILKKYNLTLADVSILGIGECIHSSNPYLVYRTNTPVDFILIYDIILEKLIYEAPIECPDEDDRFKQVRINELSPTEVEQYIKDFLNN